MKKYYDPINNRLLYYNQSANPEFWDKHWKTDDLLKSIQQSKNRFIVKTTRTFLPENASVIDGGCGKGDKVYALHCAGFKAYGVDFADNTVKLINQLVPEINVSFNDVRHLDFPDHFFDGYWSLGVIEHFYNGFDDIVDEINRVLRPGGYLFLTVPLMSKFRQYLAKKKNYPYISDLKNEKDSFYQFAYPFEFINKAITDRGFVLLKYKSIEGVKGFKDEIKSFKKIFQWIYDHPALPIKALKMALDYLMSPLTGHMGFYIFVKQ